MPSWVSNGAVGTGTTSVTPGLPASLANGDGALIKVVAKPDTATIVTPSGWTLVSTVSGGGGTIGNGTGPQVSATFFREKAAGWSTMPAISITGGTSSAAMASRYTKAGNEAWDIAAGTGVYGTAATSTSANTTMGSNPGITIGDLLEMWVTNQSAAPTWSSQSFSSAGATIGAATERSEAVEFATSPQVGGMFATAAVTAGTGSGNPAINATASAATRGTATLVRLRGVVQPFVPAMHASAPATTKSTTGTTFTSDPFTCPDNAAIVVGLTSDADSNAGAAPTITDNTGGKFTWTRKAGQGFGGVGGVGVVALFQGVPTNPGVAPGSMTITVTPNNNGTTKPRMIRWSVYPSTAVDITNPIGATAISAITTTGALSASLTPETTGGALRMMWLDWSATGVPTTTQANTGVADSYHNAGLSTNIQLAKTTYTTAGVSETIGATLLATSTSGNWLAYELRAPSAPPSTVPVTATRSTTWDTLAPVTATRATTYDVLAVVSSSRSTTWDVRTTATSARSTAWDTLARVSSQRATTYDVLSAVTSQRSTTWNVLVVIPTVPVTATRSTTWDTLASVSAARATTWDAVARVTGQRSTTWDVRTTVSATRATSWRVRAAVTSSRATTWRVRAALTSQRSTTWDTLAGVTSSRATSYDVLTPVTAQRSTSWNVDGNLAQVSATRSTTWAVKTRTTATRATTWDITARVTSSRATSWDVRTPVSASRSTSWRVRSAVTATRATSYDVLASLSSQRATTWDVRRDVTVQRSTSWNVDGSTGTVTATRSTTWDTRAAVTSARSTTWRARSFVTAQRVAVWDTRELVALSRQATWRTLAAVLSTRSTSWSVAPSDNASRGLRLTALLPPTMYVQPVVRRASAVPVSATVDRGSDPLPTYTVGSPT